MAGFADAAVAVEGAADRLLAEPVRELEQAVRRDRRAVDGDVAGVAARGRARRRSSVRTRRRSTADGRRRRPSSCASLSSAAIETVTVTPHTAAACRAASTAPGRRVAPARTSDVPHRDVPEHVGLAAQPGEVVTGGEVLGPGLLVGRGRGGDVDGGRLRTQQRMHVVRAAGLRGAAHRRALPAAERLALHDGAGDVPVDVGVADLDALEPVRRSRSSSSDWMPPVSPNGVPFWIRIAWSRSSARITPSTGPKHSVWWNHEPSLHAERTPGVQRRLVSRSPSAPRRDPGRSRLDEPALARARAWSAPGTAGPPAGR